MRIIIKKSFDGYKEGTEIDIESVNKTPTDMQWRRRLKDAKMDGCVEVVKPEKKRGKKWDHQ